MKSHEKPNLKITKHPLLKTHTWKYIQYNMGK